VKVAIIGGSGRLGRWFARFLLEDGKEVVITGRNEEKLRSAGRELGVATAANTAAVGDADVIVASFEPVVREIQPHIQAKQIIIDLTSIKVHTVGVMQQHLKEGLTLGVHPMFGPGAPSVAGQNFILTPTSDQEAALARKIGDYLLAREARVTLMTPQEHDDMMTVVLGLPHFIAIVAADTLLSLGDPEQARAVSGTTYKLLLTLAESVISEDPEFYASLQMSLPGVTKAEEVFRKKSQEWTGLVAGKDQEQFVRRMKALGDKFRKANPDLEKAYRNMYRILNS
jgi:prephenate dehydrogenase